MPPPQPNDAQRSTPLHWLRRSAWRLRSGRRITRASVGVVVKRVASPARAGAAIIWGANLLASVLMLGLLVDHSAAQTTFNPSPLAHPLIKLNSELKAVLEDPVKPLASLSAVAIRDGKVVYEGYFGRRVIGTRGNEGVAWVDHDTLYRVASVSKLVTAIGAMQLVEQQGLDLDADVSTYLGYTLRNPNFPETPISARMLLTHTSSLRDDGGYSYPLQQSLQSFLQPGGANYGDGRQWARVNSESDRAPGKYFAYVNLNWGVLASVMEAITGERFDRYMKRAVLEPLSIAGHFNVEELTPAEVSHLAVLYRKMQHDVWDPSGPWMAQVDDYQGRVPAPRAGLASYQPGFNATIFSPQGGLRIGARGLARLMQMLINEGELDGRRVLSAASVRQMLQEEWRYDARRRNGDNYKSLFNAWGLGLQKFIDLGAAGDGDRLVAGGGVTGFGHLGFAYGLNSGFFFDPVARRGMIYIIGGVGFNPELDHGQYSGLKSWEEKVLDALYRNAILEPL